MLSSASLGLDFEMILLILLLLLWWCLGVQSCQLNVIQSNPRQYIADIPQVSCASPTFWALPCTLYRLENEQLL
jgi:hypothetical protein